MPNLNPKHPNILFVLTDDQGWWALGCNGNREIITPNIDRLAEEGARFENFFCASPVCSPARATLLTGLIPSRHGVHDWIREGNTGENAIEYLAGLPAYTEVLAEAGYQCALSGKWHLGDSQKPQKGFSRWYVHQRGGGNYYNAPMIENGLLIEQPGYLTHAITQHACDFLDEMAESDAPFYLGVHYTAPHSPWTDGNHPEELTSLYDDCPFESCPVQPLHPWNVFSTAPDAPTRENVANPRESLKGYFGAVTGVDQGVGRLVEHLSRLGLLENTLIVFTSDNGFNCGHHGIWGKGNGTWPLNMYDTSVKVPLVMRHPAHIPAGRVIRSMTSAYDFMPSLLDYLGLDMPGDAPYPGRSFLRELCGDVPFCDKTPVVVFDEYGPVRMIRTYTDKYVCRYPHGPDEYYDLTNDPGEERNLAGDAAVAARIAELKDQMEQWFARYADPAVDGRFERLSGNGQVNLAGLKAHGQINYQKFDIAFTVEI